MALVTSASSRAASGDSHTVAGMGGVRDTFVIIVRSIPSSPVKTQSETMDAAPALRSGEWPQLQDLQPPYCNLEAYNCLIHKFLG